MKPTILQLIIMAGLVVLIWSGVKLVSSKLLSSSDVNLTTTSSQPLPTTTPPSSPSATSLSTIKPLPTFSPQPSPTKSPRLQLEISQWRYPNANQLSASESILKLESGDNVEQITNWYEDKIRGLGMSAKSFVKTRTNGKVLNKLVASGNRGEIEIGISQPDSSSPVTITVTIKY